MKNKEFREGLKKFPDDYEITLSKYFIYVHEEEQEPYFMVSDNPIAGVLANDDSKELRFIISSSSLAAIEAIEGKDRLRLFGGQILEPDERAAELKRKEFKVIDGEKNEDSNED